MLFKLAYSFIISFQGIHAIASTSDASSAGSASLVLANSLGVESLALRPGPISTHGSTGWFGASQPSMPKLLRVAVKLIRSCHTGSGV